MQLDGSGGGHIGGGSRNGSPKTRDDIGGTQTAPGTVDAQKRSPGGFGYGATTYEDHYNYNGVAPGGGGYYGGGGAGNNANETIGGGGSGYIGGVISANGITKCMYTYQFSGDSGRTSSNTNTLTYYTSNYSSTPTANYAKSGNGAARITPVN